MDKITALFMSIISFFTSLFTPAVLPQKKPENFESVLRFMVCSDTHIDGYGDYKLDRIRKAVGMCYDAAASDPYYKKLDAVMFVGDVTNSGKEEQFMAFNDTVKDCVKDGTSILAVVAKSHDSNSLGKKSTEFCKMITGNDSDFHVVINGYHFIGLSTSKKENAHYSVDQRIWLNKQLKEAEKDDPDKPIFVCHHEHVKNTVYGSSNFEGWGKSYFKDIFNRYPQIVHFSGHSHFPLNDARSVYQDKFTCIGTSSMNYMEFVVDRDRSIHPDGCNDAAQFWLVDVDKNNQIRLRGYELITGELVCEYLIEDPGNKSTYAFTEKNNKALSSAPEFEEDAKLDIAKDGDNYVVTAPAAKSTDGKIIFVYRVFVYNKLGVKVSDDYIINNYYRNDTYKSVSFTVSGKPGFKVEVTAENSYGMKSAPLTGTLS